MLLYRWIRDLEIALDRSDIKALLHGIFPATLNVGEARSRLNMIFQVEKLPSPPWWLFDLTQKLSNMNHLNSPFTGNMDVVVVGKSIRYEGPRTRFIVFDWSYSGQVEDNIMAQTPADGVRGTAIWDDNGVVSGFYHFYTKEGRWAGFSASISASELSEMECTLVQPYGQP
ncbi:hypothetical protein N7495_009985 [Penicillium taxi]|uniref:uncharacterized protein n=1 Tax=Penicillium taxi TaxID=168475 RepID=UPI0025456213|nr:uncharacterized protein N7495_009985 [Penicillium taxi]KAJ5885475.1 hypothetical protein N7495_009985 [Penicillium taxi]